MKMEGRYLTAALSLVLIFGGMYFKFLYDVPDGQEGTNAWVSWALVVLGIIGVMASTLWKAKNPFEVRHDKKPADKDNQMKRVHDTRFGDDFEKRDQ